MAGKSEQEAEANLPPPELTASTQDSINTEVLRILRTIVDGQKVMQSRIDRLERAVDKVKVEFCEVQDQIKMARPPAPYEDISAVKEEFDTSSQQSVNSVPPYHKKPRIESHWGDLRPPLIQREPSPIFVSNLPPNLTNVSNRGARNVSRRIQRENKRRYRILSNQNAATAAKVNRGKNRNRKRFYSSARASGSASGSNTNTPYNGPSTSSRFQ